MKTLILGSISLYQRLLSRDTGKIPYFFGLSKKTCMFYPTCSEYTKQAIVKYGIFTGIRLGFVRISRCHPWNTPTVDELK